MLVEQIQDLRRWNDDWRMSIYECLKHGGGVSVRTGEWEVVLGRSKPDYVVSAKNSNVLWAFRDAMKLAKDLQDKYDNNSKKSS